ncbi:MAG TPA: DNA cytosine methyltransferase [Candidatus Paceibacterota bacterium]
MPRIKRPNELHAVDFFCSGGGMTCGLRQAGIEVIAGIDNDPQCKETYEKNNPGTQFILADVFDLKEKELSKQLNLKRNDDNLILIGCSPCQFWSIIQTSKKKAEKSKNLLVEFKRFVDYLNPGYVLVENVPGILARKDESGLAAFIEDLERKGYSVHYEVVNMSEHGVPQMRKRFSLIASRLHKEPLKLSKEASYFPLVKDVIGKEKGFKSIPAGYHDKTDTQHSTANLTQKNLERLEKTKKNGGSWLDWAEDPKLKRKSYKGKEFKDNYGRMRWDKPAPTITTKFASISNGRFAHPEENRGISLREGATLQTFPADYVFHTESFGVAARIIGNAVPPAFAKKLGKRIVNAHKT